MNQNDFLNKRQAAVEQMREMNRRSMPETKEKSAPKPPEKEPPKAPARPVQNGFPSHFLDSLLKDADTTLILGLLLILMSEKSDKMLLFALLYIML